MTKSQEDRRTNFEQVKGDTKAAMRAAILRFVKGYRGPRQNPVSQRQITKHFAATRREFVTEAICALLADDKMDAVRSGLSRQSGTVFEIVSPASGPADGPGKVDP